MAFEAVSERAPSRVLDVGCGPGEFAERIGRDIGAEVVAIDISPRMVELACERGVDARVGDVQDLPFEAASFDCVLAAWMLYHVPEIDRALSELARVLDVDGRLVAVTNHRDHLSEARQLLGIERAEGGGFPAEDAPSMLQRYFGAVEVRDAAGLIRLPDMPALAAYLASLQGSDEPVPIPTDTTFPYVIRRRPMILVATKQ